jgi:D-sedoheptulose 7-phosphate isomerase
MDKFRYIETYLKETSQITDRIDVNIIMKMIDILLEIKKNGGRLFFLGVGGGAGNASHATNDFNKIAKILTICLSDNVSLVTALTNDEGWESVFLRQLEMHKLNSKDCLFIYSVGGGTETTSKNLVLAIDFAKKVGAKILGVVGKETGATAKMADACLIIPKIEESRITPHTEDFQIVINHLLVNLIYEIEKHEEQK